MFLLPINCHVPVVSRENLITTNPLNYINFKAKAGGTLQQLTDLYWRRESINDDNGDPCAK